MKMKIKQTLRSMWALVLAVLMLLSTFSAVAVTLNVESTGSITGNIYFDNTKTQYSTVYAFLGHNGYIRSYKMSLDSDNIWKTDEYFNNTWNDATAIYFASSDGGVSGGTSSYNMNTSRSDLGLTSYTNKSTTVSAGTSSCYVPETSAVNTNLSIMTVDEAKASHSGSSGGSSGGTSSFTFKKDTTIYFDFTGYSRGYNYINANGTIDNPNWWNNSHICSVTLTSDLIVTTSTQLFKTDVGDGNGWQWRTVPTLPTEGQNMIICSDGKTATWGTYGSSPTTYTVNYGVNNSSMGSLSCTAGGNNVTNGGSVDENTTVTFTATANSGYEIEGWYSDESCSTKIDSVGTNPTYSPTINANTNVYVKFQETSTPITSFTFKKDTTIYFDFTGYSRGYNYINANGTIDNPNWWNNSHICSVTLTSDLIVTTSTQLFKTDVGDGNGWQWRTVPTLPTEGQNMIICSDGKTATWGTYGSTTTYNVTLDTNITGGRISSTTDPLTGLRGTNDITLKATPDTGYTFAGWSASPANTDIISFENASSAETTATVKGACTITATFTQNSTSDAVANGVSLTASPAEVIQNNPVTLTAALDTPNASAKNVIYTFTQTLGTTVQLSPNVTTDATTTFTPSEAGTYKFTVTASCDGFTPKTSNEVTVTVKTVADAKKNAFTSGIWIDAQPDSYNTDALIKAYTGKSGYVKFYLPNCVDLSDLHIYHKYGYLEIAGTQIESGSTVVASSWTNGNVTIKYGDNASTNTSATIKVFKSTAKTLFTNTSKDMPTTTNQAVINNNLTPAAYKKQCSFSGTYRAIDANGNAIANNSIKLKGRGNSSWEMSAKFFGKYAYNITLGKAVDLVSVTDKSTASKKWSMLANNVDEAMMRNMLVYNLSDAIGLPDSPMSDVYNVYNNGTYLGSYQMSEKVEVAKSGALVQGENVDKLNEKANSEYDFDHPKRNSSKGATDSALKEQSEAGYYKYCEDFTTPTTPTDYKSGNYLLEFELNERFPDEISGFISNKGQQVVLKSPEIASKAEVEYAMDRFNFAEAVIYYLASGETKTSVDLPAGTLTINAGNYSYTGKASKNTYTTKTLDLGELIDVENFAKAYLIQEFTENLDGVATSFYVDITGENDVLVSKPVWDFDWTMGQYGDPKDIGSGNLCPDNTEQWFIRYKHIYKNSSTKNIIATLCSIDSFWATVKNVWKGTSSASLLSTGSSSLFPVSALMGKKASLNPIGAGTTGVYDTITGLYGENGKIKNEYTNALRSSVAMNEDRYGFISNPNYSTWGSKDTGSSWTAAVDSLDTWANKRATWMNAKLNDLPVDEYKVYLKNDANWQNVYAYAWTTDSSGNVTEKTAWPGDKMTYNSTLGLYEINLGQEYAQIIFNIGTDATKTSELTLGSDNIGRVYNNSTGKWSDLSGSGTNYYLGGRISTAKGDINHWGEESGNTSLPFTLVDGKTDLYYFDTGKTVADLSGTLDGNYQYFFIHTGSGSTVPNQWYGKSNGEFSSRTTSITLEQQTGNSTDNGVGIVRFNEPTSTSTDTVTLYFNSSTKELYYTAGDAVTYNISKADVTVGGSFDVASSATEGATVTITATPSAGYVVDTVTVTGSSNINVVAGSNNTYTFTMPAENVTVSVTFTTGTAGQNIVYLKNDANWSSVYAYAWTDNSSNQNAKWPGEEMKYDSNTGLYYIVLDKEYVNIKFSQNGDNTNQTLNLSLGFDNMGKVYNNTKKDDTGWTEDGTIVDNYYIGGRFTTATATTDGWNLTSTEIKFTYVSTSKLYKLDTGKTVSELSTNGDQYFIVHNGSGTAYVPTSSVDVFETYLEPTKLSVETTNSINNSMIKMKFGDTGSESDAKVTLWFDATNKQIWYTTDGVVDSTVKIYAKNGTLKTTYAYGTTTVSGITGDDAGTLSSDGKYRTYTGLADDRIVAQTVVNTTYANYGWYVYAYVINGVEYPATKVNDTTSTYQMDTPYILQEGQKVEITPIYLNTKIEQEDGYVTLYVDPNDLGDHWGNTISVYSYYYAANSGQSEIHMNSDYPGEPMMLESTGLYKAFIPKNAWKVENGDFIPLDQPVSGVTFNNYKYEETVHDKFLVGTQKQNYQTYDYDDFKYIAAAGYDTVKYDIKYRTNPTNQNTLLGDVYNHPSKYGTTLTIANYKDEWEDLTDIDGNLASIVGFTSNSVPSGATFDTAEEKKLYIVSTGNQNTSMGKWSTVWYVYDHDGNYITQGLPSDFIPRYTTNNTTGKSEIIPDNQTEAYNAIVNNKYQYTSAKIAYESEQTAVKSLESGNDGIRLDGRWYYARSAEELTVTTHVLYANKESDKSWTEDTYKPDFTGVTTGALATVDDIRTKKVTRNTSVTISASPSALGSSDTTYKFIGWATDVVVDEHGKFTPTKSTTLVDSTSIFSVASNTDAYALYVPVGQGDLVINHSAYSKVNPNANGGTGRYFVQAVVTHKDKTKDTYYAQNGVTVPITSEDEKIDVTLYTISTNGCTYVGTYVYNGITKEYNNITSKGGESYVNKVNPASAPATVTHSIEVSKIFGEDKSQKLSSTLDYYSDLKTNTITVKLNYYDRKVAGGTPVDINSEATTYSYKPTSYPNTVYDGEVVSLPNLINYVVKNSVNPDNLLDTYYYWTSQSEAVTAMQTMKNYHSENGSNYGKSEVTHHTNQYGEPQQSGEKWVTYYGKDDKGKVVEIEETNATAENVSTISIWYFNTPKEYSYTMNLAKDAADLTDNGDGTYYSNGNNVVKSGVGDNKPLFFNQRLGGAGGTEVENSAPNYLQQYGITQGYVKTTTETARTIDVVEAGTTKTLKFIGWATDTAGKNIVSTNYKYGLRITGNVNVYAIYGEKELDHPGVNIQGIKPEQYFDQNNVSKTRISTMFTAYNCPDSDENIENIGIVYLKVTTTETENALDALMKPVNAEKLKELRKNIAQVVSKAKYEFFKSGTVDSVASNVIVQLSGTTASGFKYKVVDPTKTPSGFEASLTNKNRGQFTHIFTTSVIKNYTYYAFATMGYKNYPSETSTDDSVYEDESGITYITSDNFAKFAFNSNGECVTKFE